MQYIRRIAKALMTGWALLVWGVIVGCDVIPAALNVAPIALDLSRIPQHLQAKAQVDAAQRRHEERMLLFEEVQRLQRLGRFDEAREIALKLDQSLPSSFLPMTSLSTEVDRQRQVVEYADAFVGNSRFVRPVSSWSWWAVYTGERHRLPDEVEKLLREGAYRTGTHDFAGAAQSLQDALALMRGLRDPASPDTAIILEALGDLEEKRGDLAAALRYYQDASALVADAATLARLHGRQALVFSARNEASHAVEASERSLKLLGDAGESTQEYAAALNSLGVTFHYSGDTERALQAYEQSLAILARSTDKAVRERQTADVRSNLGLVHWQRGDPGRALEYFQQVLDYRAEEDRAADPYLIERRALVYTAVMAVELNALLTLERALGASAFRSGAVGLQALLERKGALLDRQTRGMTDFRKQVERTPPAQGGTGVLGRLFGYGALKKVHRQQQARRHDEDRDLIVQYQMTLAERSALAQRTLSNHEERAAQQRTIANLDMRLQVMEQQLQQRVQQENWLQEHRSDSANMQAIIRQRGVEGYMAQSEQQQEATQQRERMERRAERLALLQRIQAQLPPHTVLLEMVKYRPLDPRADLPEERRWSPARYGTYVIHRSGEPTYVDFGDAEPIETLVTEFRRALAQPRSERGLVTELRQAWAQPHGERVQAIGRQLDERLMQRVRGELRDATLVLVAPEGMLNLIPFGALVDEQNRYLIERFTFNYLASGRDLLRLANSAVPRSPALIIAAPAFSSAQQDALGPQASPQDERSRDFAGLQFAPLPGTAAEAHTLKQLLPEALVLTGGQATETAVKQAKGPRIMHIATHGFFLEDLDPGLTEATGRSGKSRHAAENPMLRSGLIFAGVNALRSGNDDGVLTALEAAGLDLIGTKLVVLSACETGLGEVKNGEGVFGLRRAFIVAGAETLLMSLWQVEDEATKDLMVGYYARLAHGDGRAEALRQAQLAMLTSPQHRHPFFWASFIASGEPGGLK